jgi:hypothetical protein
MRTYGEFEIEVFQLGRDQWQACFRAIDRSNADSDRRCRGSMVHSGRCNQGR